jgi:hypothetical protein
MFEMMSFMQSLQNPNELLDIGRGKCCNVDNLTIKEK